MSLFKIVMQHFKGLKVRYLLAIGSIAAAAFFQFMSPLVIKFTIDNVLGGKAVQMPFGLGAWINAVDGASFVLRNIWAAGIILLFLTAMSNGFAYLRGRLSAQSAERFANRLRGHLYDHLQRLPFAWHSKVQAGDIIQRCTSDVDTVRRFLGSQLVELGRGIIMILLLVPIMLSLSVKMTLISLIVVPFIFAYSYLFFRRVRLAFLSADEAEGMLTAVVEESMNGIRIVKAFAREDYETGRFGRAADDYRDKCYRLIRILAVYWASSDMVCMLQIAVVLIVGIRFTISGEISLGTLVVFMTYINSLLWPVRQMGRILTDLGRAFVSLGRIREILITPQEELQGNVELPDDFRFSGKIAFEDVNFDYGDEHEILKNITLQIDAGETIAVLGATGSGKSSLAHLIPRLFENCSGKISIDGINIRNLDKQQLRRQIGIVLQEPFLYSKSMSENIAIACPDIPQEKIESVAKEVALHENVKEFEQGYETIIGERGITLSGGQRQRTAIARALILEPPILILDDSLSAVDTETEREIQRSLLLRKGKATTIIISHRLTSLSITDRIVVLEHGKIVQLGSHQELIEQEGPYKRIWDIQYELEKEVS